MDLLNESKKKCVCITHYMHISCGKVQEKIITGEFEVWLLVESRSFWKKIKLEAINYFRTCCFANTLASL